MPARTLKPEDLISHYRIVGPLGAGGMGEVYRAKDQTLERDVALKILPAELVRSEERVRRFVLEAKSASSLNHPHIVTIYEIGEDKVRAGGAAPEPDSSPLHFISMELVSGETLTTKIHREKTDLRTLLSYLAQAAEGLAKAHAAGIVHRDLKPGNIMVSKDGYAKVLDFGLAKLTERQASDPSLSSAPTLTEDGTSEGVVLGTVGYMSPEQVQGKPVDHRSDIFSFGCILYEAATRRRPFAADSGVETMHKILHETPAPIEELNPETPAELRRLTRRCIAKDPNQRLDSMRALALELREIVEEFDALSASAGPGSAAVAIATAKRRFTIVPTVAAIVLVAIAATFTTLWVIGRSGRDIKGRPSGSIRITTETNRGDVSDAALSPDGRYLAYVSGPSGQSVVRVRQLTTGGDVEILGPQATPPWGLRFSPDGDYLFYLRRDPTKPAYNALFQIPSLGGTPRQRALDVDAPVTFAPDGKRACFYRHYSTQKRDALIVLELESGNERVLARVESPLWFQQTAWSPDGRRVATAEFSPLGGQHSRIVTFRVQDGRRDSVGSDPWLWVLSIGWLPDGQHLVVAASERGLPPQIWLQSYPGGQRQRITTDDWTVYDRVSLSADGSTIASRRSASVANLWVAEITQGRTLRQMTFNSNAEHSISDFDVAEDGSVLFSARQLFTIELDGGEAKQITAGPSHHPGLSFLPGGSIVFVRVGKDGLFHLWRADGDGNNAQQLTAGAGEFFFGIPPRGRVSPDGRTVLYRRADRVPELWALPVGGGEPVRLADSYYGGADFSPDGGRICYQAFENVGGQTQYVQPVWKVIEAAGGKPIATVMLPVRAWDTRWVPDGSMWTFLDRDEGARNVFRQRLTGGKPEQLTHFTTGEITGHAWTQDGDRLVLTRRIDGHENLWVLAADGSHPVQLTDFRTGKIFSMKLTRDGLRAVFTYGYESQDVALIRNFR